MFYFRPLTDTIDTILPIPQADKKAELPEGLHPHLDAASDSGPRTSLLHRLIDWLSYRMMLRRSRLELFDLTDEQLRDIGVMRSEAEMEARKVRFHLR